MISKKNLFLCIIVFLLTFSIRLYFITQKQGFFIDEIYTRTTIVGKFFDVKALSLIPYKTFRAKSIKNWLFSEPENSTSKDLKEIWKNNYGDSAHPNLYFLLMRIGLNLSDFSVQGFINFGCGMNLIFFTFSFFIMMRILIRLFGDNKLVPIGLALAFLNTGTISMTLFIRPYEMQILGIIFISYIYLIFNDKLENHENIFNLKDVLLLICSLAFVSLIGYFLVIYIFILGLFLLWKSRFNRKNIYALILASCIALIFVIFCFPEYFQCVNDDRFYDVSKNYKQFSNFFSRILLTTPLFFNFIFYKLILFVAFVSLFFIDFNKKTDENCFVLLMASVLWELIITFITSYILIRYFTACFPMMSFVLLILLSKMQDNKQNIFSLIFICLYILSAIFPFKQEFNNQSVYNEHFYLKGGAKIENLWAMQRPYFNPNIPVYILMNKYTYLEPLNLYSTFDDNQEIVVINILKSTDFSFDYNEFYIISMSEVDDIKREYSLTKMNRYFYFDTYYARKKDGKNLSKK